jgi:recombination protein RecA
MAKKANKGKDLALEAVSGMFARGASTASPGNIPTGHFDLDFVIHHGESPNDVDLNAVGYDPTVPLGIPRGKIVEVFGEEGAGKSSLAYRVVGSAQQMGFDCAWIDAENSFSDDLAIINAVDRSKLLYSNMSNTEDAEKVLYAEDVFNAIISLCTSNASGANIGVIVIDSVASLVPKARMEANAEDIKVGLMARLMSENLGKVANYAAKYGVAVIFINQIREKIGVMWGNPETTPGGRALKFLSSLRIRITKTGGKDKDIYVTEDQGKKRLIGRKANFRLVKNRFAKPYLDNIELPIYYEAYFPDIEELAFSAGRQMKLIRVYKGKFKWRDLEVEGKNEFMQSLKYNGLTNDLIRELETTAAEKNIVLPPEVAKIAVELVQEEPKEESNKNESQEDGEVA